MTASCGHLLCELIGGSCSLDAGRSRGCSPQLASRSVAPDTFDEVRELVALIAPEGQPAAVDDRVRTAAVRLAQIIRREARDNRQLVTIARDDEPELAPVLATLCTRRR
jgi:hypothetical protein